MNWEEVVGVLEEEVRNGNSQTTFREDTPGMNLLIEFWKNSDAEKFNREVLLPLIKDITSSEKILEIEPIKAKTKGVDVKESFQFLAINLQNFLKVLEEKARSKTLLSPDMLKLIQKLDKTVRLKMGDSNANVAMSGIIGFRFICPALISFQKIFEVECPELVPKITPHSLTNLLAFAKFFQRFCSGIFDNPDFPVANRFIKRNYPKWLNFVYLLLTGEDSPGYSDFVQIGVDDLLDWTYQEQEGEGLTEQFKEKRKEVLSRVLWLETSSKEWKKHKTKFVDIFYNREGSVISVTGSVIVNAPLEYVYDVISNQENWESITQNFHSAKFYNDINSNLTFFWSFYTLPPLTSMREVLALNFHEYLPEEQFGFAGLISVENEDCPVEKGNIRTSVLTGAIVRGVGNPEQSKYTLIFNLDLGESTKNIPDMILLKSLKLSKVFKKYKEGFEEKAVEAKRKLNA